MQPDRPSRTLAIGNQALADRLKAEAAVRGFTLFGVAPATDADGFARFQDWLDAGYAGEMRWLHEQAEPRRHPRSVVEGVRSVVMLGMEYKGGWRKEEGGEEFAPPSSFRLPTSGRVAAYAQGPDYHRFLWDRLNELSAWLMAEAPGSHAHGVTDTAPLLERDFARRAGLGWFGKNTMMLNRERGSFFLLAALLTSIELPANEGLPANHCGTCTACLDACPTDAFPEPGTLDARRCISYLTIELRGPIPEEFREAVGDRIFGCDVCQEVCPWNRFAGAEAGFPHRADLEALDPVEILSMGGHEFRKRFKATSLMRAGWPGMRRNAAIVLGNVGGEEGLALLEAAVDDPDAGVSDASRWALGKLRSRLADSYNTLPPRPEAAVPTTLTFDDAAVKGRTVSLTAHPQMVVTAADAPDTARITGPNGETWIVAGDYRDVQLKIQAAAAQDHESGDTTRKNTSVS